MVVTVANCLLLILFVNKKSNLKNRFRKVGKKPRGEDIIQKRFIKWLMLLMS
jgi:hypothetical protein